jgi:hypothetical protein
MWTTLRLVTAALVCTLTLDESSGRADAPVSSRWEAVDEEEGIRLWKHEVPGLDLPGFRGEAVIAAPLERLEAAIVDTTHHTEWMFHCVDSRELERVGDEGSVLYNRTQNPWPVWDRDVVLEANVTRSLDGSTVLISFHNVKSSSYPTPERVVRMPRLVGFYRLHKLSDTSSEVTYQVEADPGGSLPRWLALRAARELPYETLRRLRARVTAKRP